MNRFSRLIALTLLLSSPWVALAGEADQQAKIVNEAVVRGPEVEVTVTIPEAQFEDLQSQKFVLLLGVLPSKQPSTLWIQYASIEDVETRRSIFVGPREPTKEGYSLWLVAIPESQVSEFLVDKGGPLKMREFKKIGKKLASSAVRREM